MGSAIPGWLRTWGRLRSGCSNYAEAIRALSLAVTETPADNPVRAMLGMSYFGSEQYADVVKTVSPWGRRACEIPRLAMRGRRRSSTLAI